MPEISILIEEIPQVEIPEMPKGFKGYQKGHCVSKETRRKISKNHRGTGTLGKKMSEETKEKIKKANKGKHYSVATQFKKGQMSGRKNGRWLGGITPERNTFYASEEWVKVVPIIWKRDNKTCQKCKDEYIKNSQFHIHHIISFKKKDLRSNPTNLILLCRKCHYWVHSKKNKEKELLK